MFSNPPGSVLTVLLCWSLLGLGIAPAQQAAQPAGTSQKYKLTIIKGAPTSRRSKKGRVSSEAVVQVTDSNNVPVPGITVTFLLPQVGSSGAAFGNGALSAIVTTNATGVASSGSISAAAGSTFSVGVSAAGPSGVATATVSISAAAVGAAVSTGVIVAIAAVVVGGAVVAAKVVAGSKGSTPPPTPSGAIGAAGAPTFGHP